MRQVILLLVFGFVRPSFGAENDDFFRELEEVYLAVFADVIDDDEGNNRVFCVAMGLNSGGDPVRMPKRLWKRLVRILRSKGVDVSEFVPADEVIWNEKKMQFTHTASEKEPWVYSVLGIDWHGGNCLHVSQCKSHGALTAGGSTLVLAKRRNKWVVIDRVRSWLSEHGDPRIPEQTHFTAEGVGSKKSRGARFFGISRITVPSSGLGE